MMLPAQLSEIPPLLPSQAASSDPGGEKAAVTLDAELEAFVRDIHDEVEHLRAGCAGLERRMEELTRESLRKRALQQKESLAAQRSCSDAVEAALRLDQRSCAADERPGQEPPGRGGEARRAVLA